LVPKLLLVKFLLALAVKNTSMKFMETIHISCFLISSKKVIIQNNFTYVFVVSDSIEAAAENDLFNKE